MILNLELLIIFLINKIMKHLFFILYISITFNSMLLGQEKSLENIPKDILECIGKMGDDNSPTLNECECKYLNFYFQKYKGTFDFCGKKICSRRAGFVLPHCVIIWIFNP